MNFTIQKKRLGNHFWELFPSGFRWWIHQPRPIWAAARVHGTPHFCPMARWQASMSMLNTTCHPGHQYLHQAACSETCALPLLVSSIFSATPQRVKLQGLNCHRSSLYLMPPAHPTPLRPPAWCPLQVESWKVWVGRRHWTPPGPWKAVAPETPPGSAVRPGNTRRSPTRGPGTGSAAEHWARPRPTRARHTTAARLRSPQSWQPYREVGSQQIEIFQKHRPANLVGGHTACSTQAKSGVSMVPSKYND